MVLAYESVHVVVAYNAPQVMNIVANQGHEGFFSAGSENHFSLVIGFYKIGGGVILEQHGGVACSKYFFAEALVLLRIPSNLYRKIGFRNSCYSQVACSKY